MNNAATTVKDIKLGEYFCLKSQGEKEVAESKVWVRGEYDKSSKRYEIYRFDDINNTRFVKGNTPAFLDFIF